MRIVVTEVTGRGSIRRGVLDTGGRSDAGHCQDLIERAALDFPPPYRPVPGGRVYHLHADDKIVLVAEGELTGPLRELVMTTLAGEQRGVPQGHRGGARRQRPGPRPVTPPVRGEQPGVPDGPGPTVHARKLPGDALLRAAHRSGALPSELGFGGRICTGMPARSRSAAGRLLDVHRPHRRRVR